MKIRAPRPSDAIWIGLGLIMFGALHMIFAPDPVVPCPEDSSCDQASLPSSVFFDAASEIVH